MKLNQLGYSLAEILVATAILGLGVGGFVATTHVVIKSQASRSHIDIIDRKKEQLQQNLNSRNAWIQTVNGNNIACLREDGGDCVAGSFPIAVFDGEGNRITDLAANNLGFNSKGVNCVFGAADCGYRFLINWSPICESMTSCKSPIISISATFEIANVADSNLAGDPNGHGFTFIRGTLTANAKDNCESIKGIFDDVSGKCRFQNANQMCPQGEIVKGINADGTLDCKPLMNSQCGADEYAKGVNPDGSLICNPIAGACTGAPPDGFNPDPNTGFSFGDGGDGGGGGDCGGGGGGGDCGGGS